MSSWVLAGSLPCETLLLKPVLAVLAVLLGVLCRTNLVAYKAKLKYVDIYQLDSYFSCIFLISWILVSLICAIILIIDFWSSSVPYILLRFTIFPGPIIFKIGVHSSKNVGLCFVRTAPQAAYYVISMEFFKTSFCCVGFWP